MVASWTGRDRVVAVDVDKYGFKGGNAPSTLISLPLVGATQNDGAARPRPSRRSDGETEAEAVLLCKETAKSRSKSRSRSRKKKCAFLSLAETPKEEKKGKVRGGVA